MAFALATYPILPIAIGALVGLICRDAAIARRRVTNWAAQVAIARGSHQQACSAGGGGKPT